MTEIDVHFVNPHVYPVAVASTFVPTPSGLAAAPQGAGGAFAAGTYFWVITGTDALGETTASNEATAVVVLNGSVILTWNPLPPGTTGVKVYRGVASGAENALIATLGSVVTFTDTGAAGGAATPPVTNTAEIGTQVIYNGRCHLRGWGIRETSGTTPCNLSIRNGAQEVAPVVIASGQASVVNTAEPGILFRSGIRIQAISGVFAGSVYLQYAE